MVVTQLYKISLSFTQYTLFRYVHIFASLSQFEMLMMNLNLINKTLDKHSQGETNCGVVTSDGVDKSTVTGYWHWYSHSKFPSAPSFTGWELRSWLTVVRRNLPTLGQNHLYIHTSQATVHQLIALQLSARVIVNSILTNIDHSPFTWRRVRRGGRTCRQQGSTM